MSAIKSLDHHIGENSARAAPGGLIPTNTAISEAVGQEVERRAALADAARAESFNEHVASWHEAGWYDHLLADLAAAACNRELVPVARKKAGDWEMQVEFFGTPSGSDSLLEGTVCHLSLSHIDKHLSGAPLYFKRDEWQPWITARRARQGGESVVWPLSREQPADDKPAPAQQEKASPRTRGNKNALRRKVEAGLRSLYPPDGRAPPGVSIATQQKQLKDKCGTATGQDTIRRVLGLKP